MVGLATKLALGVEDSCSLGLGRRRGSHDECGASESLFFPSSCCVFARRGIVERGLGVWIVIVGFLLAR